MHLSGSFSRQPGGMLARIPAEITTILHHDQNGFSLDKKLLYVKVDFDLSTLAGLSRRNFPEADITADFWNVSATSRQLKLKKRIMLPSETGYGSLGSRAKTSPTKPVRFKVSMAGNTAK